MGHSFSHLPNRQTRDYLRRRYEIAWTFGVLGTILQITSLEYIRPLIESRYNTLSIYISAPALIFSFIIYYLSKDIDGQRLNILQFILSIIHFLGNVFERVLKSMQSKSIIEAKFHSRVFIVMAFSLISASTFAIQCSRLAAYCVGESEKEWMIIEFPHLFKRNQQTLEDELEVPVLPMHRFGKICKY
jgi:hypothetical protein